MGKRLHKKSWPKYKETSPKQMKQMKRWMELEKETIDSKQTKE